MKHLSKTKPVALTLAAAIAMSAALPTTRAHAGNGGELIAAGLLGLAVGAIITDMSNYRQARANVYHSAPYGFAPPTPVGPQYGVVSYPEPVTAAPLHTPRHHRGNPHVITYEEAMVGPPEPWSQGWYHYCQATFRTFDPASGTYMGYDGRRHFCVAK